jgi:hypothetical protein
MGLQQFERRLERLVEGVFAKAFRSGVEPVEIGRRLRREMDQHRTHGVRGTIAPNHLTVALSPSDHENFQSFADSLTRDLADYVREHAREEHYTFVGPVLVELTIDESLVAGQFLATGQIEESAGGGSVGALVLSDGTRIGLGDEPATIGRLPECEVPLTDPNVSRRHAEVRRQGMEYMVVDLGSTNGTRVNGSRVRERRLADGDEIAVGNTTIRFEAS